MRDRYAEAAIAAAGATTKHEATHGSEALSGCCGPTVATAEVAVDGSSARRRPAAPQADACCGDGCCSDVSGTYGLELYDAAEREGLPDAALLASLGCGNPVAVAELREGETVLDLGLGRRHRRPALRASRRPDRPRDRRRHDRRDARAWRGATPPRPAPTNVEFRKGTIEALPLDDASVDVVISNCVINLASDKAAVFAEIARVLRPGGRVGVSDIVADDLLTAGAARRARLVRRLHRRRAVVPRDARRAARPSG